MKQSLNLGTTNTNERSGVPIFTYWPRPQGAAILLIDRRSPTNLLNQASFHASLAVFVFFFLGGGWLT